MKIKHSYDQKILNALTDFLIIKYLNKPEQHIQGMTGKDILFRLRAFGVNAGESTIYSIFSKLRRNGLITKGRTETDDMCTEVTYFITKQGEKYFKSINELLSALHH